MSKKKFLKFFIFTNFNITSFADVGELFSTLKVQTNVKYILVKLANNKFIK